MAPRAIVACCTPYKGLGGSPESWLKKQMDYDLWHARRSMYIDRVELSPWQPVREARLEDQNERDAYERRIARERKEAEVIRLQ